MGGGGKLCGPKKKRGYFMCSVFLLFVFFPFVCEKKLYLKEWYHKRIVGNTQIQGGGGRKHPLGVYEKEVTIIVV